MVCSDRFFLPVDIENRFVGDLIAQVASIRADVRLILNEVRLVLIGLRPDEAEEMVESFARWPVIERAKI